MTYFPNISKKTMNFAKSKVLFFLISSFLSIFAQDNSEKVLKLKFIDQNIIVDGNIDLLWSTADSLDSFVQFMPYHNQIPTKKTVVKLLTTESSLFGIIIAYDNRDNIQAVPSKLDNINGDAVSFMFDTFNDRKTAYKLIVSPSGARSDARLLDDGRNRDYSWDGIWFSEAKIYDWGYVVEVEIPYKSIQYDENLSSWGFDVDRWIQAENQDIYLCSYDEAQGQRISKFGAVQFTDFRPSLKGLSLEMYPVAISKASYLYDNKYKFEPSGGFDLFYNPSPQITLLQTVYPDFAQIEADPYNFSISRYETYFSERRPFFSEGNEIFAPSGKEKNSGFYTPLELLYSRRIGKKMPDGSEVPLISGSKVFGRYDNFEYGGFFAITANHDYKIDDASYNEPEAFYSALRLKKTIFDNSTIGILYSGKYNKGNHYGVLDIDGAFRKPEWQLAYQVARSFKNEEGDYALSVGFKHSTPTWLTNIRSRHIGENFDINQIGYVPWKGVSNIVALTGPVGYYNEGIIRNQYLYFGGALDYTIEDDYTDKVFILGGGMEFRSFWGYEISLEMGKTKDKDRKFDSYQGNISAWFHINPQWNANIQSGFARTFNFARDYLSFYSWFSFEFDYKIIDILYGGTSYDMWIEGNPNSKIEEITYNARPYLSLTPINDLNFRLYVDNVYIDTKSRLERVIVGFLFSYSYSPKSWIYLAINEIHNREYESSFNQLNFIPKMQLSERVLVFKIKYLYYL